MDNYNFQWRVWARVIAVLDLIGSLFFLAPATYFIISKSDIRAPQAAVDERIWVALAHVLIITVIAMWAAIHLITATELGRDVKEAYKYCKHWRMVYIGFVGFSIIFYITVMMSGQYMEYTDYIIWLAASLLIRCMVHQFISELKTAMSSSQNYV